MLPGYYDMDGKPIGLLEWAALMEAVDARVVGRDDVGDAHVSTVLLGLDHNFGDGPPVIFETMVFGYGDDEGEYQWRYRTKEEALAGHQRVVAAVRDGSLTQDLSVAS